MNAKDQSRQELSALIAETSKSLEADYNDIFFGLLQGLGIFEPGDFVPVPIEVWRALAQVLADQSGYRIVMQAVILEPIDIEPRSYRTVGYSEVHVADPTLFVQEAGE
jgi:hypothetical protein